MRNTTHETLKTNQLPSVFACCHQWWWYSKIHNSNFETFLCFGSVSTRDFLFSCVVFKFFLPAFFRRWFYLNSRAFFGEAKKGGWKQVSLMSLHNCPPKKSWKLLEKLIGTPGVLRGGYLRVWELRTFGFWFFFGWVHKCHGSAKWMVVSSLEPSQLRLVGWLVVSDFPIQCENSRWLNKQDKNRICYPPKLPPGPKPHTFEKEIKSGLRW